MAIHRFDDLTEKERTKLKGTKGKHSDGGGLYLQVAAPGQASWVWRHKERWLSIGPANAYTLDQAREKARLLRVEVAEKRDPFQLKRVTKAAAKTFAEAMTEYLDKKSPHWAASNRARELSRYQSLFRKIPEFTALHLSAIDQDAKNKALATWNGQFKAQRDVGFYIAAIIKYAETGTLRIIKRGDDNENHFEAMPWADVPSFYAGLARLNNDAARALRFTILTGARTDEVIGAEFKGEITKAPATWREIKDVDGLPTWVIPGGIDGRMKGGRTHLVPLTSQLLDMLGPRRGDDVPLFDVSRSNALRDTLKAHGGGTATVHGFRSSFSDWATVSGGYNADLVDACIAHLDKSLTTSERKVRRSYQRDELMDKRREIFNGWSAFVTGAHSDASLVPDATIGEKSKAAATD